MDKTEETEEGWKKSMELNVTLCYQSVEQKYSKTQIHNRREIVKLWQSFKNAVAESKWSAQIDNIAP